MSRHPARSLIVMTRLPVAGSAKSRLIPALGAAGAAAMHDRMARHVIGRAAAFVLCRPDTRLTIRFAGGTTREAREWLAAGEFRHQGEGDLGERMREAFRTAFAEESSRAVLIGSDCPSLDEMLLDKAFDSLDRKDLVFGPAEDGGYYLVGMNRPCPEIFDGISWGSAGVLKESLARASLAGRAVTLLEPRRDVDNPGDLAAGMLELRQGSSISVIVPTLNEAATIFRLVKRLASDDRVGEVIVSDGGSRDGTPGLAAAAGAVVISGERGRGTQMNRGAAAASGEILLFLHADTLPPAGFGAMIARLLEIPGTSAGAFRFSLGKGWAISPLVEVLVELRCRIFNLPYGDQGLFMRRRVFLHAGGFANWPVMEDLDLVRRMKAIGRLRLADGAAITSTRRWRKSGLIRTTLVHQLMLVGYLAGMSPRRIAELSNHEIC